MELPFDSIVVDEGGELRNMNVSQFMALDLPTRIRLVMTGSVKFFSSGSQIPQGQALGALQKLSATRR